ncbi:hypothetical protein Sru01_07070 [Sphaerisporangium rufum]|uniref:Uncharacterized protein n=1 Tax=Sphaerisporangium rufum TaxID=1381558 RepID=A0A919R270_9ACTN|nr:hypothetical protein [Sphaerisporangium rufum]GII75725.1 hypothetical protein Sru01_07070 [Sphaerisporangium rufum]
MTDRHGRGGKGSGGDRRRGSTFDQQGQRVNGPQYNADQINIGGSISPDDIAEGLRRDRERTRSERQSEARFQQELAAARQRDESRRRREESDLKEFGYRYYTRDRNEWLQSLSPRERWDERRRQSDRTKYGTMPGRHHQRILRAGNLPPDTSPADSRYLRAKREIEHAHGRRERYYIIAAIAIMLTLGLIAVTDGAGWLVGLWGVALLIGLARAYARRKASP